MIIKKIVIPVAIFILLSLCLVGCNKKSEKSESKPTTNEHPSNEHPSNEHPSNEHPSGD